MVGFFAGLVERTTRPRTTLTLASNDPNRLVSSSMQELYLSRSPSVDDCPSPGERKKNWRWYQCRNEPFTVHKSVSEASMYRANSRFSLKSDTLSSRTLDYLMSCFWVCSTGCHQTT